MILNETVFMQDNVTPIVILMKFEITSGVKLPCIKTDLFKITLCQKSKF